MRRRAILVPILSLLLLLAGGPALARGGPAAHRHPPRTAVRPAAGPVRLEVLVVHARPGPPHIDPALRELEPHLRMLRYDSFTVLDRHSSALSTASEMSFSIPGGRRVSLVLQGAGPARARLRVQLFARRGKVVDTTVSVNRDGTFIVGGPRYLDGVLLLPITARY